MSEVLFVTDNILANERDHYGWNLTDLHKEMLKRAMKEGWPRDAFGHVIVKKVETLGGVLKEMAGTTVNIMEIQLHGFREDGISYLMTNWNPLTTLTHMDFVTALIDWDIRASKIIIRACGVKASDYNNYDYDGRGIIVEIGAQGKEYPGYPINNPSDLASTGAKIWEYYGRRYFPNHMEVEDLILPPIRPKPQEAF